MEIHIDTQCLWWLVLWWSLRTSTWQSPSGRAANVAFGHTWLLSLGVGELVWRQNPKMFCSPKSLLCFFLLYLDSVEESMSQSVWGCFRGISFYIVPIRFRSSLVSLGLDLLAILSDHHWLEFATSAQESAPSSTLHLLGETLGFGSVRHQICWMSFAFDFELSPSSV